MSADITLVTIGGAEKFACLTGETLITEADGRQVRYGQLSWALGQALLRGAPGCPWSEILHEMTDLIRWQQLPLMVTFHGQITGPVGDLDHSQLLFNSGQIGGLS